MRNRLIELEECERIQSGQDFNQIKIADNNDLEECERISRFSDLKNVDFQTETGAVLDWVIENPNDFARIGGKRDPLHDEW